MSSNNDDDEVEENSLLATTKRTHGGDGGDGDDDPIEESEERPQVKRPNPVSGQVTMKTGAAELAQALLPHIKSAADLEELLAAVRRSVPDIEDDSDHNDLPAKIEALYPVPGAKPQRRLRMVLCFRELTLQRLVTARMVALGRPEAVEFGAPNVGDIMWVDDTTGVPFGFVVEHKTTMDLAASIADPKARGREQYARMEELGLHDVIMYLIDGDLTKATHGAGFKSRLGFAMKKVARDKVRVAKTATIQNSADLLVYMHYWLEHVTEADMQARGVSYLHGLKGTGRKRDMRREHRVECTLLNVNGVSEWNVKAIVAAYPTMADLLDAYDACPGDGTRMLEKIRYTTSGGHERFIGIAVSRAIAEWFDVPARKARKTNTNGHSGGGLVVVEKVADAVKSKSPRPPRAKKAASAAKAATVASAARAISVEALTSPSVIYHDSDDEGDF